MGLIQTVQRKLFGISLTELDALVAKGLQDENHEELIRTWIPQRPYVVFCDDLLYFDTRVEAERFVSEFSSISGIPTERFKVMSVDAEECRKYLSQAFRV